MSETIAALSTPLGVAALGVIRISGPEAATIAEACFKAKPSFPKPSEMKGYTMAYGDWCNAAGERLDEVILAAFRAPHSYTGEDLYEISFHGGSQVRQSILESLFEAGAVPAAPGEFSKRAFLNGKMDLSEAEAVMDLISAESQLEQKYALKEMGGSLSRAAEDLRQKVLRILADLENFLEFSEEDFSQTEANTLSQAIRTIEAEINYALSAWKQGRILRDAFRICILGLSNAGKSTLLNALIGSSRAIVSDISGTTRDTLDVKLQIAGIPVLLTDTAGLRETADLIEKEGIQRALAAAEISDLIFWLHDPTDLAESINLFKDFRQKAAEQEVVHILGKQDLFTAELAEEQRLTLLSALGEAEVQDLLFWTSSNVELLENIHRVVADKFAALGNRSSAEILIHNIRHKELLENAAQALNLAEDSLLSGQTPDITAAMLRNAVEALARMSGSEVSDELIESIFSRFCVGK